MDETRQARADARETQDAGGEPLALNKDTIADLGVPGGGVVGGLVARDSALCVNTTFCVQPIGGLQPVATFKCTYDRTCGCISWNDCSRQGNTG